MRELIREDRISDLRDWCCIAEEVGSAPGHPAVIPSPNEITWNELLIFIEAHEALADIERARAAAAEVARIEASDDPERDMQSPWASARAAYYAALSRLTERFKL